MKKFLFTFIIVILTVTFTASCGCSENNEANVPDEENSYEEGTIIPNDVEEGSDADIAVRSTVKEFLDAFIACDFEKINESLHEDDKWLFNFESKDQMDFYKTIFPLVSYEFESVKEHDGVYGVMTKITSPNMADVYGTVITEYLDSSVAEDNVAKGEIVKNNTERMLELISSEDIIKREERLFIYVEYIDGVYIPRCDAFLANELTGGAPEASDELTSTIEETIDALNEQ